ncbi:hypothetical protein ALC60_09897 [Trachymyrmex zeteki]|uniref:Uncharacterized protein n=1 Tax=Mycetomoellerius zeteki TaxID=64791 RepID=A0A151WT42_9HYME|nr:hypothetical protein ALC60_09897 [Trachymyrmex zeteki]
MCSHENITWTITDNSVTDRMLENSLIHKFRPSRKIRKSTKLLNTKIKKHCGVKDYKHYVELKTNVIRNLVKDTDTSDSSSLSDVDYDIIYNSSSKRAKYKARSFQNYVSIRKKDYEGCNRRIIIHKKKSRGRRKQNTKEEKESSEEKIKNFPQLNQIDNVTEIHSINHEDRTHFVKSENLCDVQKQQLSPKENIKDVHSKSYNNMLDKNNRQTNDEEEENNFFQLNQVDKNAKMHLINQEDKTYMKQDTHDTQKRQTSLPKIMCTEILNKKYKLTYKKDNVVKNIVDHNTDNLQEAEVNEEEIETPMALETDNEENNMNYMSPQTKKRLQQQATLNLVVNSDSSESDDEYVTTKTSQKHIDSSNTSYCSEDDNLNNDEINCAPKQNICICKKATSEEIKLDSTNTKEDMKKTESLISFKCSNTHLNSSCQYRPRNLQQLIEDQDLFVEKIPASFTLADLSEDEEAFILNVPSKVLQSNLQGQVLTLKEKSIKLNESKYRIVRKEVGTTSCIFATGKKQKPYKIINIKNISTITVREKLPQDSRKSNVLNSNNTVSSVPKALNKNQQTNTERNSKSVKISNKKRKRDKSSGIN